MTNSSMTRPGRYAVPLILLAALFLIGCGGGDDDQQATEGQDVAVEAIEATAPSSLTTEQDALVQKAAAVANAVEKAPETMTEVLADAGLTSEEFESMVYRISADPVLAKAYEEARKH